MQARWNWHLPDLLTISAYFWSGNVHAQASSSFATRTDMFEAIKKADSNFQRHPTSMRSCLATLLADSMPSTMRLKRGHNWRFFWRSISINCFMKIRSITGSPFRRIASEELEMPPNTILAQGVVCGYHRMPSMVQWAWKTRVICMPAVKRRNSIKTLQQMNYYVALAFVVNFYILEHYYDIIISL
jgi:hypothetical protein